MVKELTKDFEKKSGAITVDMFKETAETPLRNCGKKSQIECRKKYQMNSFQICRTTVAEIPKNPPELQKNC